MSNLKKTFGFYPEPLQIDAGPIRVRPLAKFDSIVESLLACDEISDGWIYAPPQKVTDFMSGEIRTRPYSARVFGLPKTHVIEHAAITGEEHLEFHVWALSFFLGMRLTTTEAGFLDATPVNPLKLVDFMLTGTGIVRAIKLVEAFWMASRSEPRNARRFVAAVHSLFIGQYPQALQFEEFIYLYTAIDACYALTKSLRCPLGRHSHRERIEWMCGELGVSTPYWAETTGTDGTELSALRNDALHEALFIDEPLGFAIREGNAGQNLTLEMNALVCRLLMALIGGKDESYLRSPVNTRQRHGLNLN